MTYKDLGKVEYLPFAESVDLMKNRQLDATLQSAGLGVASLRDLATSVDIIVVAVPKDDRRQDRPALRRGDHSGQHLHGPGQGRADRGGQQLSRHQYGVTDDLVYEMTKLVYESLPELAARTSAGKEIKLETAATGRPVPLHPGAKAITRKRA